MRHTSSSTGAFDTEMRQTRKSLLKTKRHTEGIVGMGSGEAKELGEILHVVPKLQKEFCNARQIYIVCFTELVSHLHIHLIPRGLNEAKKGPDLFCLINEVRRDNSKAISVQKSIEFVRQFKKTIDI